MKKASILMAAAVLSVIVSGCAKQGGAESDREFTPTESSVYVSRDGGFSSALVETYDKDYYDQAELQAFLEEAVALYNGGNSGGGEESEEASGPVSLVSCTLQDGVASSVFKYSSADDLIQFSRESGDDSNSFTFLDTAAVSDGVVKGYIVDGTFVDASGAAVKNEDITKQSRLRVICAQGGGIIQTEGKVLYMTEGVTPVDEFTVSTPDEGKSYIIIK